jgi:hypothetical protein
VVWFNEPSKLFRRGFSKSELLFEFTTDSKHSDYSSTGVKYVQRVILHIDETVVQINVSHPEEVALRVFE